MQTPSSAPIRAAIEVLKKFGEPINHSAVNVIIEVPATRFGDHGAARVEVLNIEQITRTQTVVAQSETWREELRQERRPGVSHHV